MTGDPPERCPLCGRPDRVFVCRDDGAGIACTAQPYISEVEVEGPPDHPHCFDGFDNDCDFLIDCQDPDCGGDVCGPAGAPRIGERVHRLQVGPGQRVAREHSCRRQSLPFEHDVAPARFAHLKREHRHDRVDFAGGEEPIGRLNTETLRLDYPWQDQQPYLISIVTSTGSENCGI